MHPTNHDACPSYLRHVADQNPQLLALEIHDQEPSVQYPEFPPVRMACPHGVWFWLNPTPDEAARLRAMNAGIA